MTVPAIVDHRGRKGHGVAVGQVWRISLPAPWLLSPVGTQVRVISANESSVGYRYLAAGTNGVSDVERFRKHFTLATA